jgi:Dolichyl-phosphate-mannose-protein mannosyltransferase
VTFGGRARDALAVVALLIVAALLRLPDLATRAAWDADQGAHMLALRAFVRDGVVPLVGPATSIGGLHHGAAYYFLLSPAAWLTGGDSPLAVATWIAFMGIAAVGVTWWLGRAIGGPVAGFVAGLAMAVSAASVEESTFIWNPNLVALTSGIALAGAWHAWSTRQARWWLLAALGTALTVQCHVLGIVLVPVIGALYVADVRRRPAADRRGLLQAAVYGLAIVAVLYLPLAIHELATGGAEMDALVAYVRDGGSGGDRPALPVGIVIVALRVVSWPLAGLITSQFAAAAVAAATVIGIVIWRWSDGGRGAERTAVRWLGLGLLWSAVLLAVLTPALSTVVPGLPNDHYHAFADPMVFVLVGLGAAAATRTGRRHGVAGRQASIPMLAAAVGVAVIVLWNLGHQPARIAEDGGFPDAEAATARILAVAGDRPIVLRGLPAFKGPEAITYPLVRAGHPPVSAASTGSVVVVICDPLFEPTLGASCGGPAEDASLRVSLDAGVVRLVERWPGRARRVISIYAAP